MLKNGEQLGTLESMPEPLQTSGSEILYVFHDASGNMKTDDIVVQANVFCRKDDVDRVAWALEQRSHLGCTAFHYREMRGSGAQSKTAHHWASWYSTDGYQYAPFSIRAFKVSDLVKREMIEPAYCTYNRQAKYGILAYLQSQRSKYEAIELNGFLDSHANYVDLPIGSQRSGDNLPVYLPQGIMFHADRDFPRLVCREFVSVPRKERPDHLNRNKWSYWRLLQLADLLAGICGQAILERSKKGLKRRLGEIFRTLVCHPTFESSGCIFQSYDLQNSRWNPSEFKPFVPSPGMTTIPDHVSEEDVYRSLCNN